MYVYSTLLLLLWTCINADLYSYGLPGDVWR